MGLETGFILIIQTLNLVMIILTLFFKGLEIKTVSNHKQKEETVFINLSTLARRINENWCGWNKGN